MRDFGCPHCGQRLAFENSVCLSCCHGVGFDLDLLDVVVVDRDGTVAGDSVPGIPRLVVELELGLPITDRREDADQGLTFDLLSSHQIAVTTAHHPDVITLDWAEGDDVHREQLRSRDEPYRTWLGHFRPEIGHCFAHYLHLRDTVDTAAALGFAPARWTAASPMSGPGGFTRLVELSIWSSWALTMANRSRRHRDLHPFALSPRVLDEMAFAHRLVSRGRDEVAAAS